MIAYITGKIIDISESTILILPATGVWYEIGISSLSYGNLVMSDEASLYLYHHITEWWQGLFGFESLEEKMLFSELIKISWVWGKVALQILSLWKSRFIEAIISEDRKTIEGIKGIGKKMAEKIVLELKDKDFIKTYHIQNSSSERTVDDQGIGHVLPADMRENIAMTLQNMGYQSRDIHRAMQNIPANLETLEDILPYMIRKLS